MGAVGPSLEYGANAWATAAKTYTNKLDKAQNIGLWTILGAMKTTPMAGMEKTAGVEQLERKRQAKLLIHAEKMKRMPDHPLHQKLKENISTLAKTTCVVFQWIPAHTGIRGNEIADQLAKEGREKE